MYYIWIVNVIMAKRRTVVALESGNIIFFDKNLTFLPVLFNIVGV